MNPVLLDEQRSWRGPTRAVLGLASRRWPMSGAIPRRRSSIDEPALSAWLAPIAAVLDGAGTRWALMGAAAALRYRRDSRLTTDIDVLVEAGRDLGAAFRAAGFQVREVADPGETPHLLLVRGNGVRADLLVATVEYQRTALDRAVGGVLTVEDVIIHKLIAWRPRDQDDVVSILRAGHTLDEAYVERWAREWEVLDRWEEARRSA